MNGPNANQNQVGGTHYRSEYQHWDFVRLCLGGRYLEGNVTKYVARHKRKDGIKDLHKALHYLDKMRELFDSELYDSLPHVVTPILKTDSVQSFVHANELGDREAFICEIMVSWNDRHMLNKARVILVALIAELEAAAISKEARAHGIGTYSTAKATPYQPEPDEPGKGYTDQG